MEKIIVLDDYVLSYIIEPGNKVYYVSCSDKLYCSNSINKARVYISRGSALIEQESIKRLFDLEFQIEKV